jgi:glycosyltransferase involved in cell wall biosynthesis
VEGTHKNLNIIRDSDSAPDPGLSRVSRAPLLSIIIPTYNLESYIVQCLDSITAQAFQDIEIIAVDGASSDLTCDLLERRAQEESRLRVMRNGRIGPGLARNVGAELAVGDYIWFVDGDDEIGRGSLSLISDRLLADHPDVLLVNHAELRHGRVLTAGPDDALLRGEDSNCFSLAERPWLVDVGVVSWNKIVRREFFESVGAEFTPAWPHEDVPVSCELLLAAQRLSVLSDVCYCYRRRRGSATVAGPPARHFTVFSVWRGVLERNRRRVREAASEPRTIEVHRRLFQRSIRHCIAILSTPGYVASSERRAFFGQTAALYADYVPDRHRLPGGFRGVKFWLIARNSYLGYSFLDPLNKVRLRLRRLMKPRAPQ